MRSASNYLALYRHSKKLLIQFLSLVLIVSSLSVISFPPAEAAAGSISDGLCSASVGETSAITVSRVSNDCVVQFKASTTWTSPAGVNSVRLLIVAGGGAGGGGIGGGGGAGEFIQIPSYGISGSTSYSILVGAGGAGRSNAGNNGGDSGFHTVYAMGGAGGGYNESIGPQASNGPNYGSGGGGSYWTRRTTTPYSNVNVPHPAMVDTTSSGRVLPPGGEAFRNNGGQGSGHGSQYAFGGGGGGAGGNGVDAVYNLNGYTGTGGGIGGDAGVGRESDITGVSPTPKYAGGGGGGVNGAFLPRPNPGFAGAGRDGGGQGGLFRNENDNNNSDTSNGFNAIANSGSGGGGASNGTKGGNGGSGIVIVRYAISSALNPTFATPTPEKNGYTVQITNYSSDYTWNVSSSPTATTSISDTGLITVTGLADGASTTLTVATARSNYFSGSATVAGSALSECTGTTTSVSDGYTTVRFTNTGRCVWATPAGVTKADLLVVGGGGAGGTAYAGAAGGGGGGQVIAQSDVTVSGVLTIQIGTGGVAQSSATTTPGGNGGTSSVTPASGSAIATATGGSGGASVNGTSVGTAAGSGFNGGGGAAQVSVASTNGAAGTGGNKGGAGNADNQSENSQAAGGGGGSGGTGVDATSTSGGAGGAGVSNSFTGSAIVYGGGGGGGKRTSTGSAGVAGTGGGGAGGLNAIGTAGTDSRGGGGGGGGGESAGVGTNAGGAGGSGVVVIRYVNAPVLTATSVNTITATVGAAITALTVTTATNSGPATFAISPALPSGLAINSSTGTVSGTPSVDVVATDYTITATNTSGVSTRTFSLSASYTECTKTETSSDGYTIERITQTGSCVWTTPTGVTAIEVAVIGGGGGGGFGDNGGGGGAGEALVTGSSATLTSPTNTTITSTSTISTTAGSKTVVTIGAGGTSGAGTDPSSAGDLGTWSFGGNGGTSRFGEVTATGGGGGGGGGRVNGAQGGSGGGGANGGTAGAIGTNAAPSGWTSFRNPGAGASFAGGGGAGGAGLAGEGTVSSGSRNGGLGITLWGNKYAGGGGGGGGRLGAENNANDTVLGGNGRLFNQPHAFAGTSSNTSAGVTNTGTGGGAGAPGGSGVVIIRYALPTLTPAFDPATATADGFTVQISNFNVGYTWSGTATESGSVAISDTGLVTVTGVAAGTSSTATITNTTDSYTGASATVSATSNTGSALTPTFGTATPTADGFTVQITNYDANYTWATPTVTAGSVSAGTPSGANRLLTVTGLTPGQTATITQGTSRTGYSNGTANFDGTATTGSALTPTFGTPTATADGFTVQISNYSASYTWAGSATPSGVVSISGTGLVTVTGVAAGTSSTATITTTRTGYTGGSATVSATSTTGAALTPTFGTPTATADGFTVQITNYSASYTWATPTVTAGSVSAGTPSGSNRLLTVTGLTPGQSATITQGTSRTGYSNGTATVQGTASTGAALTPTFGTPTATADGFTVSITNYNASYTWATPTVSAGSVSAATASGSTQLLTVTGLTLGQSATITQGTSRTGYSNGTATVQGTALTSCTVVEDTASLPGYTILKFTDSTRCVWINNTGKTEFDIALVGGGGAGGFQSQGAGGGAGQVVVSNTGITIDANQKVAIEIGAGGSFRSTAGPGNDGQRSTIYVGSTLIVAAQGGGGGAGGTTTTGRDGSGSGGSGGGGRGNTNPGASGGSSANTIEGATPSNWTGYANVGGNGFSNKGGGGGGAGGAGSNGSSTSPGLGGTGISLWSSTSESLKIAGGGAGYGGASGGAAVSFGGGNSSTDGGAGVCNPSLPCAGADNKGAGGGTNSSGGSGLVLFKYVNNSNATLSALTLSNSATLSPNFATGTTSYTASVANSVATGFTITPTVTQTDATTVQYIGSSGTTAFTGALGVGANIIRIVVTAGNGSTTSTYTVTVTRAGSSVATLSTLSLSDSATLSPTFASGTTSYTASVANSVATGFTVTPTVTQANATTIQYLGDSGTTAFTGALSVGANIIRVVITAQDGTTTATYSVTVTRAGSSVATLSAISLSNSATLSPTFASGTTSYTASVANAVATGFTITPTVTQESATIRLKIGSGTYAAVTSGSASSGLALSEGSNTITIEVTAQNGTTKNEYTITVTRLESAVAPTIGTQPTAVSKTVGQSVTFTVVATASDMGDLSYQWQKGGVDISGALSATYTFTPASTSDAGNYRVVITNTKNLTNAVTNSNAVALTLSGAISITTPTNGLSGTFGSAFTALSISTSGGSGTNLFAVASGTLPAGLSLNSGTGEITGTPTAAGDQAITVQVSDSNSANATTSSFTISISAAVLSNASTPTVAATAGVLKSFTVSWSAVTNATSYTLKLYATDGTTLLETLTGLSGTSKTLTASDYTSLADGTAYKVSVTAIGSGNYSTSSESAKASVTTATTFIISYSYNGATSDSSTVSSSYITGASGVTLPSPAKTGHTLDGWYGASDLSGTKLTSPYTPTQSITLYAKWIADTKTITYAPGTGGSGSGPTSPLTVSYGSTFLTPANTYTRAGFTFVGWSNGSATFEAGATYPATGSITANVTLTATWSANTLTVVFDTDGGSTLANGSVLVGATLAAPTAPTKTDLNFVGWSRTSGGALVTFPYTHAATSDFTLYAIWTAVYTTGLRFYVDATDTSSLASNTATAWRSIAPATSTASGNPQNATVALSPSPGRVTFGALKKVTFGRVSEVSTAGDITVESWIKLPDNYTQTVTNQVIAHHYYDVSGNRTNDAMDWYWMISNGRYYLYMGDGLGTEISRASALVVTTANAGKWVHVAFVQKQNGDITFYFNGKQAGTATGYARRAVTNTQLTLGINSSSSMNASISKFRIYAGALTIGQIQGNMNADASDFSRLQARTLTIDSGSYSSSTSTPPTTTATASAGTGTKTFTSSTTAVCTVNSSTGVVAFVTGGTCTISASIAADSTYDAATSASISFTAVALTITYNSKGGSSVSNGSTVTGGAIAAAPTAPTLANYTFAGWSATDGGTAVTFPFAHGKTASFSLYAKWTANAYKLTYVYNSADGGTRPVDAEFTTGGNAIVLPTPTRTGYTFDGWFSNAALTTSIGAAGGSYSPAGTSLTPSAYAKWVVVNYSVTYATTDYTGGAAPTDSASYNIGNNVIIKANTGSLARTGYSLVGWTAASDGTGTVLTSGSTFTTSSSNMTFYPKWSANTYTVTYSENGATGDPAAASATYTTGGTAVTLTAVGTMAKTGFDFSGWSETPTGTVLSGGYTTAANVTLYAIWTIKNVSITFDKGLASGVTVNNFPANTSLTYGSTLTLAGNVTSTVVISGAAYAFVGWSNSGNIYGGGDTFLLGESAPTFVAEWVKIFAVRYALNGGTAAANSSEVDAECTYVDGNDLRCIENQSITTNAAPSRAGYTFAGWVNQGDQAVPTASTTIITASNYLFYANWTAINYAITYNTAGGSTAPTETTKQIGQTFTVASQPTRTGYDFAGWSDTTSIFGAGVTYIVGASAVTLTAQWTPKVYTVIYDWNGGSGSTTANDSYTVPNSGITLPVQGDHVKDGYTFGGWSLTDSGSLISGAFTPTANTTLYAIWNVGTYTLTYNANGGSVSTPSATIVNGSSLTLPTPTRANFVFEGWYSASTGGLSIGAAGANFQPAQSRTVYARWTQSSLYGLSPSVLTRIGTLAASDGSDSTFTNSNSNSSVTVVVPDGALPAGTNVYFDRVGDFTRAQSVIAGTNSYIISLVVSWLALDGTVPNTNAGKSISVTISNASIKAGASVYGIVAGNVTLLGTAVQNGTVTVQLTSDPEVVVVATKPGAPTNLAVTTVNDLADLTWTAPSSDGGSEITGYTVTGTGGVTCTTTNTSCAISGLTTGTAYTFTVTATNALGTSAVSTSAGATTASRPDSPTSVAATSNATRQSVISWTAPASNGGSAIIGYTVTANNGSTCTTATTSCTISGLADGTSYTFTVTATNAIGTSDPSSSASATTASAVVNNAGGGGSGGSSSTPAPVEPVVPSTPAKSNVTIAPSVTVIGDSEVKIPTVEVTIPAPESQIKPPVLTLDAASKKFIAEVKVVEGKIVLTPETGFSGKRTVTVTITENGDERFVQIPLTVLPEPVAKPVLTPTAATKSIIRWSASDNADSYSVLLNSKRICSTSTTSCSVNRLLGPGARVEVVSNGGDRTLSERIKADFKQTNPVTISRIVSATNTKKTLSAVDTKALDKVVVAIKSQGFGTVVISEITTTSKTKALAAARIESIKKYISSKIGDEEVQFEVTSVKSRTYFNNISVKG